MNTTEGYIRLHEKEPLLPEPVNSVPRKNKFINWFKTHASRLVLTGLWLYLFVAYIYTPRQQQQKYQPQEETFNIESYNEQQFSIFEDALSSTSCKLEPGFAFDGVSEFEFDPTQFQSLFIEERQGVHHKNHPVQIAGGETHVVINESIDTVKVNFDITVSHEELLDTIWIEDSQEEGQYKLTVHEDDDDQVSSGGCLKIDVKIQVPSADALKSFQLALTNNGIELQEGLIFDNLLKVSIANGHLEFGAIEAGITRLSTANGHITGTFSALKGDLSASVANGHTELKIKEIAENEETGTKIALSVVNGHNDLEVPVSFESRYHLSNVVGRRIVESSQPNKIHRKSGGWRTVDGYFGDDANTKNTVTISTVSGSVHLNYV